MSVTAYAARDRFQHSPDEAASLCRGVGKGRLEKPRVTPARPMRTCLALRNRGAKLEKASCPRAPAGGCAHSGISFLERPRTKPTQSSAAQTLSHQGLVAGRKFRSQFDVQRTGRNGNVSWKRPGPLLLAFAGAAVESQAQSSNLLRHLAASFSNLP